jgi:hypothetical protein
MAIKCVDFSLYTDCWRRESAACTSLCNSAAMYSLPTCTPEYSMLNCVMCYTGISAAAGMAADRMKATAAHSRAIHGSRVRWVAGSAST